MAADALQNLVSSRYGNPEIEKAIIDDVAKHGTEARILTGELALPTVHDATHWFQRTKYGADLSPADVVREDRIRALEALVAQLVAGKTGGA